MTDMQPVTCPLYRRLLNGKVMRHHLYPHKYGRMKGHKVHAKEFPIVRLEKSCHRMVHALFSEKHLAEHFNTIEVLRGHLQINSFLDSIVKKPPGFDVWVQRNKLKESNR
jgi:hypothetical protein